ncbi:class I SAM-dependent methyltransferase [Rhizobium oryzicola]|uniref:Class I SAM-dependent methyltransferase n=1 Tax=Rhizobium oryzicola TaxID=1232668 RepID=A0ABT8T3D4_9HYPH|nr:class I SAM-dependent methyltransferase [Rhizobium oryzicola]MDO1584392.1 class I SAM-dependent methyltransferase [Rhizobium oryzicola]
MNNETTNSNAAAHDAQVQSQFGARANSYVTSAVHSTGEDLAALTAIVADAKPARAIDLGCGGGHVSYAMAAHAGRVVAVDLSADMLAAVARTAAERGLGNIETVETSVESLPFDSGHFDFLGCRYTAHHWHDVTAGLREGRRVLKAGAPAVFIDVIAPAHPLLDTHLQAVELLRDTSHVRDYSLQEWTAMLGQARFGLQKVRTFRVKMEFDTWIRRMATPADLAQTIRRLQVLAASEVKQHFEIEPDGSFMLDMAMFETIAI